MDTLYIISVLLKKQSFTQKQLCEYLGLRKQTFSEWNAGRSNSYQKYLPEIAKFFNITVDELINADKAFVEFWDIYCFLCYKNNKSPNSVASDLGLSNATCTKWKNGAIPNSDILTKIAEYFNVTTDYLLGIKKEATQIEQPLSTDIQKIIAECQSLSDESLQKVIDYVELLRLSDNQQSV